MSNRLSTKAAAGDAGKPIVGINFRNVHATKLTIWIEPYCIEIELKPATEYRIESDGTEYILEFEGDHVTLFFQNGAGPKVFNRPYSPDFANAAPWTLDADYSD